MPNTIKDGTGKGFELKIDSDNRAHVASVQASEEHHENEDNLKAWTASFDAVDPTGADDYFVYMQNTAKETRVISRISITSTAAGVVEVQHVTGTALGGGADEVNSWTIGAADPSEFTFQSGVDITGLTDAGVLRFAALQVNITEYLEFPQTIRLPQNQAIALLWTASTGGLTGNIDFYEEG